MSIGDLWIWLFVVVAALAMGAGALYLLTLRGTAKASTAEAQLMRYATILVAAAEQLYEHNPDKLDWVLKRMAARFPGLSPDDLREVVEWAVFSLKKLVLDGSEEDQG